MTADLWTIASGATLYAGCNPPAASKPSWVTALALWQWYEIPNTAMSSCNLSYSSLVGGSSGPASKVNVWNGGALKVQGSEYIRGPSGGHLDWAGNETDSIILNSETPTWVNLRPRSADADIINTSEYYLDLRPAATHTYYSQQFINSLNKMIMMPFGGLATGYPGAANPPAGWPYNAADRVSRFDRATNDWESPTTYTPLPSYAVGDGTACLVAKHPITEEIYYRRNNYGGFTKFNPTTGVWTNIAAATEYACYGGAAIDPTRDRMLVVGSFDMTYAPRYIGLDGLAKSATFGGLGPTPLTNGVGGYPGVQYDPVNDCYYVIFTTSTIDIYRVRGSDSFVDLPAKTGTAPPQRPNGISNSAQYVPELGGIVGTSTYTGNMWFIRTSL